MAHTRPSKSVHRESGLVQRMRVSVRVLPLANPHVLLACSGGKDSVALAWILAELRRLELLTFDIAHIHHGQHDRADAAAEAVVEIGRRLDTPVVIRHLDRQRIDAHIGVGLEEAMRRERYLALSVIAQEQSADGIALAHHQMDQAETILLHLVRGTGVEGLAGMQEWEQRRIPWWTESACGHEIGIWRPLIGESMEIVTDIAQRSDLPIIEDPTNLDPVYRRNAIRHQILPVLEGIAEGAIAAMARSAGIIASDADLLVELTQQALETCDVDGDLSRIQLVEIPDGMRRRVVRHWVLNRYPNLELSADRVDAVIDQAMRNRGGTVVEIGSGRRVTLQGGLLKLD